MTRKEFKEKYAPVIASIQEATHEVEDRDEAADKLISSIRAKKEGGSFESYPGIPEGFDYDQAYADWQSMVRE